MDRKQQFFLLRSYTAISYVQAQKSFLLQSCLNSVSSVSGGRPSSVMVFFFKEMVHLVRSFRTLCNHLMATWDHSLTT